ncbi:YigZ family protein [Bacillota bacterium LX-D]|nr:YigZ family protein [Bacillota bacterium LX-D]
MLDEYKTVARSAVVKAVINRSEFIAHVQEVDSEKEAKSFIADVKEKHKQATHNCSAYSIGLGTKEIIFSDDNGEPSGTGGKPILGAIKSSGLTNCVVVVTRYFGGKKLGVRGLIDAYGGVAKDAIDQAGIVTKIISEPIAFNCSYADFNNVQYYLHKYDAQIIDSDYGADIKLKIKIRASLAQELAGILEQFGTIIK